jgi:hypothetical protein
MATERAKGVHDEVGMLLATTPECAETHTATIQPQQEHKPLRQHVKTIR